MSPEIKSYLLDLIHSYCLDDAMEDTVISDYPSLLALSFKQELREVKYTLLSALEDYEAEFSDLFEDLCARLAQRNKNSCLSMTSFPHGQCNQLLKKVAQTLYPAASPTELLNILLPQARQQITLKYINHSPLTRDGSNTDIILESQALEDPSLDIAHLVVSDVYILDLNDIIRLPFPLHIQFYQQLTAGWPRLARQLYQRNDAFKALEQHVRTVSYNGRTPQQAISQFKNDLYLCGENLTGDIWASDAVLVVIKDFLDYLSTLPRSFEQLVLSLKDAEDYSLGMILNDLDRGECVVTAANKLYGISRFPANQSILHHRPRLSDEEIDSIKARYRRGYSLPTAVNGLNDLPLPTSCFEHGLQQLDLDKPEDLLLWLIVLPTSVYPHLIKQIKLSLADLLELVPMLEADFLNGTQLIALNQALMMHAERFEGLPGMLAFAQSWNRDLTDRILAAQPLIHELLLSPLGDTLLIHYVCASPGLFRYCLQRFPYLNWPALLQSRDSMNNTPFHHAATCMESLDLMLSCFPQTEWERQLSTDNNKARQPVCTGKGEPRAIIRILSIYAPERRLEPLIRVRSIGNNQYDNLLYKLMRYLDAELMEDVLDLLSPADSDEALQEKLPHKNIFSSISNSSMLRLIWSRYPQDKRLDALSKKGRCFEMAIQWPAYLATMLELVSSPADRLKLIQDASIRKAAQYPESLRLIIDNFPSDVVSRKIHEADSLSQGARNKPEVNRMILPYLYPSGRFFSHDPTEREPDAPPSHSSYCQVQ